MPDPSQYSSESEFLEVCVPMMMDEGKPQDQAVAACMQMWEDHGKAAAPDHIVYDSGIIRLTPDRAYSVLTVKSVDAEQRVIEGWASKPEVDRIGDIVDPLGCKMSIPMPLLWSHRQDEPVGHVVAAKATKEGISIRARIAKIAEAGPLKDSVDRAWQAVKAGLVQGLSIGFKPREFEPIENGGLRFTKSEIFELSLVVVPACASATITMIKSIDQGIQAASGNGDARSSRPGASGNPPVNIKRNGARAMSKSVAEHISALEAKRAANQARMEEIMAKAMEEGRSTDEAEREEFDGLEREVETVDDDLRRYRQLEKTMLAKATPVTPETVKTVEDGAAARAGMIRVRDVELPKGIRFARVARCLAQAQGNRTEALRLAEKNYGSDQPTVATLRAALEFGEVSDLAVKAAVPAGSTTDTQWAGALVSAAAGEAGVVADFVEFLRPMTIIGKFGTNGIPSLTRVPFRTGLVRQHSGGTGYWVGEGAPKPVTKVDLSRQTLLPTKVANIAVVTDELLRDSSPSADMVIRNALAGALGERMDRDFIDPAITASGARPASITSGATVITSASAGGSAGGGAATRVRQDIRTMMGNFLAADNQLQTAVWIMRSDTAMNLTMMTNSLGEPETWAQTIDMRSGGTFMGLPVIVSQYVPQVGSPTGDYVILLDARLIWFADEGGISIDFSREAAVAMEDAPTGAAATGSPGSVTGLSTTSLVSLWQENLVGWRAERTINWKVAVPYAVQVLGSANWGE